MDGMEALRCVACRYATSRWPVARRGQVDGLTLYGLWTAPFDNSLRELVLAQLE